MVRNAKRKYSAVAACMALAALATACGSDSDGDKKSDSNSESGGTIGFAWTDTAIEVYKPLIKGAQEEADKRGYEILESNNGGDVAKQLADVSTWIGQGVTGIVMLPLDPAATKNAFTEAKDAGVIVAAYSDPIEGQDGSTTWNHPQGGEELGQHAADWINENLGGKAKIGLLALDEMQVGRERIDGAMEVIEEQTDSEVVGRTTAVSAADALPAVQSMLQKDPEMNVVLCVADDGCLGAAQAYKAAGIDPDGVYLAGWDGALGALKQVKAGGYIKADAALDLLEIGRSIVYVVDNVRNGEEPVDVVHDYQIVDKDSGQVLDDLIASFS